MADEQYTPEAQNQILMDLETLFRAGKIQLPERAAAVSSAAGETDSLTGVLNSRAALMGDPMVMQDVVWIVGQVHNALTASARSIDTMADGLIYIARDFAARDDFARSEFDGIREAVNEEARQSPPPELPPIPDDVDPDGLANPGDGEAGTLGTPNSADDEREDRDDDLAEDLEDDAYDYPGGTYGSDDS